LPKNQQRAWLEYLERSEKQKAIDKQTLADEQKAAAEAYGVWKEKNMYGRKVMGIERTTFVIGPDGKIEKIYGKVKAKGHAAAVLAEL